MALIHQNIKVLRKNKGLTQEELANKIGITRSVIGAYEEERADPKIETLQNLAHFFNVSIDSLLNEDLQSLRADQTGVDIKGSTLRILSVVVNDKNEELITAVPVKAHAGYLNGYSDLEFTEALPRFNLPVKEVNQNKSYRLFQITGDSMLPIASGSYILTEYIQDYYDIKNNKCYIIISKDEGIEYKRVINMLDESKELVLKSDNAEYPPYTISQESILEVWKAIGFLSFNLPDPEDLSFHKLSSIVMELKKDINKLKDKN